MLPMGLILMTCPSSERAGAKIGLAVQHRTSPIFGCSRLDGRQAAGEMQVKIDNKATKKSVLLLTCWTAPATTLLMPC